MPARADPLVVITARFRTVAVEVHPDRAAPAVVERAPHAGAAPRAELLRGRVASLLCCDGSEQPHRDTTSGLVSNGGDFYPVTTLTQSRQGPAQRTARTPALAHASPSAARDAAPSAARSRRRRG